MGLDVYGLFHHHSMDARYDEAMLPAGAGDLDFMCRIQLAGFEVEKFRDADIVGITLPNLEDPNATNKQLLAAPRF